MADRDRVSPLEPSPALRAAIARDLTPVAPLPPPLARMLWVVPIGFALLVAAAFVFGVRRDRVTLGWGLTWGTSAAEMLVGLALIAAALRESVPGTTLRRATVRLALVGALALLASITLVTAWTSPIAVPRGRELVIGWICFAGTFVSALPPLALSAWLAHRAYPLRPAIAGALYGLGSGVLADAGWRIFCHFSDPVHVFAAHVAAVIAAAALGAALGSRLKA